MITDNIEKFIMYDKYQERAVFLDNQDDCPHSLNHAEPIGKVSFKHWMSHIKEEAYKSNITTTLAQDIAYMYQQSVILIRFAKSNLLSPENIDFMVKNGAYIDFQDEDGNTPLMIAVQRGNLPLVKTLIMHGANPYINNKQGKTPCLLASGMVYTTLMNVQIDQKHTPAAMAL